ncbi:MULTISPECIES: hypothetical protein [unclassified Rhodococcus]|uniref:hypothetical protein n=1 Tax=unclassified Rhodococcus (in: high G+C Gram-positive bacteria) TaxID=192944 RepID=UPI0015C6384B
MTSEIAARHSPMFSNRVEYFVTCPTQAQTCELRLKMRPYRVRDMQQRRQSETRVFEVVLARSNTADRTRMHCKTRLLDFGEDGALGDGVTCGDAQVGDGACFVGDERPPIFPGCIFAADDPVHRGATIPRRFFHIAVWEHDSELVG